MQTVDNIIIGAGPGGYELAAMLTHQGESVVIIERDHPGGTCLNRGCIPTKCLCATASTAETLRRAADFGINGSAPTVDYPKAIERMRSVVEGLRQGVLAEISAATLVRGEARLTGGRTVAVDGEQYEAAKRLVIATGSCPARLPIPGSELALTSDDVLADDTLPASVVIVGGGVIGMEFASIFNSLGVETTVIEFCKEILPPFEAEIAKRLRTAMGRRGVNIVVGAAVSAIEADGDGYAVTYQGKRGEAQVNAQRVVMAVGRRPVLPAGVEEAGLQLTQRGFIDVDEKMQTNLDGVYAIGDVNGVSMLAHSAIAQGRVVAHDAPEAFNKDCVPSVVFTMPEVSMVGRTSVQLDAAEIPYRTVKRQFASNGKACAMGEGEGVVKLLVSEEDNSILGATILGPHAADLIAEATILVADKVPYTEIGKRYIHAHPTLSEVLA